MAEQDDDLTGKWCVLRTAAPRTLLLAAALVEGGIGAWTPTHTIKRPGRGKDRHRKVAVTSPITPTFVFAPAIAAAELMKAARSQPSPYPPFSILRRGDRGLALIRDRSLAALRMAERKDLTPQQRRVATGSEVRLRQGGFAGMTGIVESDNGKAARVNFGAGFVVTIASYILTDDVVHSANKPTLGIAA